MRHLIVAYPRDRNVWSIETQYLFGSDILVVPVLQPLSEATTQAVYVPTGTWFDFWTKEVILSRGEWRDINIMGWAWRGCRLGEEGRGASVDGAAVADF